MMTLDEAIRHAEQTAASCDGECADDHWQLADWLRELRRARMEIELLKTLRDGFKADARKYEEENAKLRGDIVSHALNNGLLVKCVTDRNDALKELVRDYDMVLSSMHALCDCDFVPLNDATLLALRSRMHELGIEVK